MMAIDVDFDVFKALTNRRSSEEVSYNDVIRELLGLSAKKSIPSVGSEGGRLDWVVKGVRFRHGTEFRARYQGQIHYGKVENGKLVVNDQRFSSPSAAAREITHTSVNGWTFWECRMAGSGTWEIIKSLRSQSSL